MGKLIKNMVPYWKSVIAIFLLLIVQAVCDLSLPQYTSNIIDIGIMNNGMDSILPNKITSETYTMIEMVMDDNEKEVWQDTYNVDGNVYIRKDMDKDTLSLVEDELLLPILLSANMKTKMAEMDTSAMQGMHMEQIAPMLDKARETVSAMIETTGESTVRAMGISFAVECNKEAGIDMDQMQMQYLIKAGLKMLSMALMMGIAAIFVGLLASRVGAAIGRNLRGQVFEKVTKFSNAEMDQFSTASLITRSTNDIQQVQMVSTMLLRMILYAPILGVGGIVKVINTKAGMGWVIVLAVVVVLGFVSILVSITMPKFKLMQTLVDRVNLVSREILTGLSVIRAFGREKKEEERFNEANIDLTKTQLFTNRTMSFMMPGMMLIMNATTILIMWVASKRIDAGVLQIGELTAFITYTMLIIMSFLMLTMMSVMLPRAGVAASRIQEVVDTKVTIKNAENAKSFTAKEGVVEYQNVSFAYPNAKEDVLHNLSFVAKPGQITAIIGSTGCGKSTLINLLPRFYDITNGSITIDGINVKDIPLEDLRDCIGIVPQKAVLFSGTIASNLSFGKSDATKEEMQRAADIAQAAEFIEEKKEHFETEISQGGTNVSGGQKQRLAIARALVKNPKILIFDDSFSALDMKTDAILRKELMKHVKDTTMFIVAQRISTILHADQIIVLEDGNIQGIGTHEELLKTCEVYEQIARSQLSAKELGLEEGEV